MNRVVAVVLTALLVTAMLGGCTVPAAPPAAACAR